MTQEKFMEQPADSHPSLSQMQEWARGAGLLLRQGYGKDHQIDHKGRIDLVTEMDKQAEAFLVGKIQTAFPTHKILTEETGWVKGVEENTWYIDPLDGTTNYAHHMPVFAVSLAYAHAPGDVILGVVYDPMRDECFSAEKGRGAWLNGQPVRASLTTDLLHALLSTGFAYDKESTEKNLAYFAHFSRLTQGVRRMGAAALDLCYVACGRVDGYWDQTLQAWDVAAGALIVEEAGGIVTSLTGNPDYLRPPYSILASNRILHAGMLAEVKTLTP